MGRTLSRLLAAWMLIAVALWAALPVASVAGVGWRLTVSPQTLVVDRVQDVAVRLQVTAPLMSVSCLRLELPGDIDVHDAQVESTSVDGKWEAKRDHSDGSNRVRVFDKDRDAPLMAGDWVDFTVRLEPSRTGPSLWLADVLADAKCKGLPLFSDLVALVVESQSATPMPTPTPTRTPHATGKPTPTPTPTPTSSPTPMPTIGSTLSPAPTLAATASPRPTVAPSASPTAPPTPGATNPPTPSPTARSGATATPAVRPSSRPSPSGAPLPTASGAAVAPPPSAAPSASPEYRYEMPNSLYSWHAPEVSAASTTRDGVDTVVTVAQPVSWFIPAVATGVPGILIIGIVAVQLLLGVSWLPSLGRILGPVPVRPDEDSHLWWANGRPLD